WPTLAGVPRSRRGTPSRLTRPATSGTGRRSTRTPSRTAQEPPTARPPRPSGASSHRTYAHRSPRTSCR
ncbi:MAG: hypothetical protein AVDCRST_MAG40-2336, partial [uncultured Gemmatimonadaceae bacterium]